MSAEKETPKSYKQTKISPIPVDWGISTIGQVTTKVGSGSTPRGGDKVYTNKGVPFIRSQNVNQNRLIFENLAFIPTKVHARMKATVVKPNDILLNITGASIGRSCVVPSDFKEGNVNQHVCIVRTNDTISEVFLNELLSSWEGQKSILRAQVGGNREGLNHQNVRSIRIPLPPLPEQQKIADILSTWDACITELDQLIAAKKQLKKGLMQQLLTGQKRFPEFVPKSGTKYKQTKLGLVPDDWEVVKLGRIVDFLDGKRRPIKEGDRKKMQGKYPYYGASGIIDFVNDFIFDEDLILLGEDGENILSRNLPLAFIARGKYWVNNHAHVLKPKKSVDIRYLVNFLETIDYRKYNTGTAQPKLNKDVCSKIMVLQPSIPEQQKIAATLSAVDNEIQELEMQKTAYQIQKKGLMQVLLTGKVRVNTLIS